MEEEQKPEEAPVVEETAEVKEAAPEETAEEAPAEEAPAKEAPAEESCCSPEATKSAEDLIRDLVNMISVMKEEEKEGVTTRVDPEAANELTAKLEELAKKVGEICG